MWNLRCLPEVPCQPIGFPLFSESDFVPAVGAQAAAAAAAAVVAALAPAPAPARSAQRGSPPAPSRRDGIGGRRRAAAPRAGGRCCRGPSRSPGRHYRGRRSGTSARACGRTRCGCCRCGAASSPSGTSGMSAAGRPSPAPWPSSTSTWASCPTSIASSSWPRP